jgi:hypothetical protein
VQATGPGLQVQPVSQRPGLSSPSRRRRGVHPPAAARNRVPVVLRDGRGDHRGIDDVVRRRDAEILRPGEIRAARAGAMPGGLFRRQKRVPA